MNAYLVIGFFTMLFLSMVIWSITDLLREIRRWVEEWRGDAWLTLHNEVQRIRAETKASASREDERASAMPKAEGDKPCTR